MTLIINFGQHLVLPLKFSCFSSIFHESLNYLYHVVI